MLKEEEYIYIKIASSSLGAVELCISRIFTRKKVYSQLVRICR